ncbi:phage tail tube protein [Nitrosomonas communis]|uniref:Uncharacterized protein n=1 Tax=Nitrosomonas communis TaxID=44574 RepID=A0A1I4UUZ8_9PROT|nr:phage tail tube protein [Nitrosomonas communis]SFM92809.1 hypothetical protein SAMN05421863_107111 [Nitrosomonas communis]
MAKLMRNTLLLAKIEASAGVDPVPTAGSNSILCRVTNPQPVVAQFVERNNIKPYFGNKGKVQVSAYSEIEIEVEIAAAGAAGTAPKFGSLLRACAFSETISAGVSVVYAPVSSSLESITIYFYLDGVLHKMTNCRGTVTFDLNARNIPVMKFKFTGIYSTPTDTAVPGGSDFSGFKTPFAVNKLNTPTLALHGIAVALDTLSLAMNNDVKYRNLVNSEDVIMVDRNPNGSASIEMTSVATKGWHGVAQAGTLAALQVVHGSGAGNIVQFDAPKVQINDPQYNDQDGIAMLNIGLQLQPNAGNDELIITVK